MPEPIKSEIINPPPNEPQPDRSAQLDSDLSKLFDSPPIENKPVQKEPAKETKDPVKVEEKTEQKVDKDPVSEPEKLEVDDSKPKTKEGWKVLRESHAKAKKVIEEKDAELTKLKAVLAEKGQITSQEAETLKKEIEDLKRYRAMVDIQSDPEFISKFDEPITKRTEQIAKMLGEWGVAEAIIQKIDYMDSGLIDKISDSIAENKDKLAAKKFLRFAEEINELYDKKNEYLDDHKKNYKNILENKKKETFTKQAENEGRMQKHLDAISQMKNEHGELRFEFLVDKVAKDPSNAAEVSQVEQQNNIYSVLREQVKDLMKAETPEEKVELAVAAAYAKLSDAKLRAYAKKIESLQSELAKVSKVSSETPKTQRVRTAPAQETNGNNDYDLDTALSNFRATI